jgi:polysaccharide pyruvyl transferase WcaK-like protein
MKAILVSFYAVNNVGDRLLTDCVNKLVTQKGGTTRIVDIQGRIPFCKDDTDEEKQVKYALSKKIQSSRQEYVQHIRSVIADSNLIIFAGGALFDLESERITENIYIICKIALEYNIPVAFNAVGVYGRVGNNDKSIFLRKALLLPSVKWISIRDGADEIHSLLNENKRIITCFDPAIWASDLLSAKIVVPKSKKQIGINIIAPDHFQGKDSSVIKDYYFHIYRCLTSAGFECLFFTNGVITDNVFAKQIVEELGLSPDILLIQNPFQEELFLDLLSNFVVVISSRLHTSICCFSLKIPSLCLSWDRKMDTFYNHIGRREWILPEDALKVSPSTILQAINQGIDESLYTKYRAMVIQNIDIILSLVDNQQQF